MVALEPGKIVLFFEQNGLCAGILLHPEERNWVLCDMLGTTLSLPPSRFVLVTESTFSPSTASTLTAFFISARELAEALPDKEIRDKLFHLKPWFDLDEACQEVACPSDRERFALYLHLRAHPEFYAQKKALFHAREEDEVISYSETLRQSEERKEHLARVGTYLSSGEISPETRTLFARELRSLALNQEPRDLLKILRQKSPNTAPEEQIHALRLNLGDIFPDSDPITSRSGIPVAFEPGLEKYAAAPDLSLPEAGPAFTIDAMSTPDYDDAISLRKSLSGYELGIHITEAGRRISPGTPLYAEARERVSSLYLPNGSVPLLPESLTRVDFSLLAGEMRPTLSLQVQLNERFKIESWSFSRQLLKVEDNFSYDDVDSRSNSEPFATLLGICRELQRERIGGPDERKDQYNWNITVRDGDICIQRIDNISPSRFIIEELMILFNRLVAERASKDGVPLLYRNINQFWGSEDEDGAYANGIQAYLSTEGNFHPGVGSQAYVHATSPIRRFADIVNQQQFLAHLEGKPLPYAREDLESLIPDIEKRLLILRSLAMRSERYWLLKFLAAKYLHEPLDAVLLRQTHNGYLAELNRWHKRLIVACKDRPPLQEPVKLIIYGIDLEELVSQGDIIH